MMRALQQPAEGRELLGSYLLYCMMNTDTVDSYPLRPSIVTIVVVVCVLFVDLGRGIFYSNLVCLLGFSRSVLLFCCLFFFLFFFLFPFLLDAAKTHAIIISDSTIAYPF